MDQPPSSYEIERRQLETFRRLHRLVDRGYVAQLGGPEIVDAIWLYHLAAGPQLILYPDGKLVGALDGQLIPGPARDDDDRIKNEAPADVREFDRFVAMVKPPTWWQRGAPARDRYILTPGCLVLSVLIVAGIGKLLEAAWRAVTI